MNQFTRLVVDNYQSIGHADLTLGQFNVIVGRYHLGKSALLRSMQALIFNETGDDYIRHGEKSCSVYVELSDGQAIKWERDQSGARYTLWTDIDHGEDDQGIVFTKLAGGVPEEIQQVLGIREIEIDKGFLLRPQIYEQHASPMLMTESSGRIARALAKMTKMDVIVQAQVASARDLRKERSAQRYNTQQVQEAKERLDGMEDVEALENCASRAEELLEGVSSAIYRMETAEEWWAGYSDSKLAATLVIPKLSEVRLLADRIDELEMAVDTYNVYRLAATAVQERAHEHTGLMHEAADLEQELHHILSELAVCPTCERPM